MQKRGRTVGSFVDASRRRHARRSAFTLIELLVVVAIIAVLISILLPSLSSARKGARAAVCATNQRQVGQAVGIYLASNNDVYPPSYVYASGTGGQWDPARQETRQFGYVHFSWMLYNRGQVPDGAFTCPEIPNGGHPRTNPGPRAELWAPGQIDESGAGPSSSSLEDKQATFMAFTGNAAVFSRNKYETNSASDDPANRLNKFVRNSELASSSRQIILLTEVQSHFEAISDVSPGNTGGKSKSHRAVSPFGGARDDINEYSSAEGDLEYSYASSAQTNIPDTPEKFGLLPQSRLRTMGGLLTGSAGVRKINAVGRHHPGGDNLGGTTNFLYVDGSVQRKTILETMINREWGTKYYSMKGRNDVIEFTTQFAGQ